MQIASNNAIGKVMVHNTIVLRINTAYERITHQKGRKIYSCAMSAQEDSELVGQRQMIQLLRDSKESKVKESILGNSQSTNSSKASTLQITQDSILLSLCCNITRAIFTTKLSILELALLEESNSSRYFYFQFFSSVKLEISAENSKDDIDVGNYKRVPTYYSKQEACYRKEMRSSRVESKSALVQVLNQESYRWL